MPRAAVISVKDDRQLPLGSDAEGAGAIRRFPTTSEGRGCERERHFRQSDGKTFAANIRLAAPRRRQTTGKNQQRGGKMLAARMLAAPPPVSARTDRNHDDYIHKYTHVRRDTDRHHDEVEEVPYLHI